jgi:hypothetical protein
MSTIIVNIKDYGTLKNKGVFIEPAPQAIILIIS